MGEIVMGVFKTRKTVQAAIRRLSELGYTSDDISVLMSDETRTKEFGIEADTKAAEGAVLGGTVGATLSAVFAAIVAIGSSFVVPGLGLVIVGPIVAAFAGAGVGGLTGGIIGALAGAGIPEYRAKVYEKSLHEGGILVGVEVKSDEDIEEVENLFEDLGAEKVSEEY